MAQQNPNKFEGLFDGLDEYGGPVQGSGASINNEQDPAVYEDPERAPLSFEEFDEFGQYINPPEPEPIATEEGDDPTWQDYGRMVMSGGANIGEGMGWLLEKVGAEDVGGAIRERSKASADAWINDKLDAIGLDQEGLSDTAVEAMQTEFLGEGSNTDKWNKAKLTAASSLLGTMAGMGIGGGVAKGLTALTATQAGTTGARVLTGVGYGIGEASVAAPSTGAATEDEVLAMNHKELMEAPEYVAAYESMDKLPEAERQQKAKKLVADAAAGKAAALTALSTFALSAPFTGLMGRLTKNVPSPGGRIAGGVKGGMEEATQEFLQSGAEAISTNIGMREADPTRDLTEDALEQAVGGALAGGMMGGPVGVLATGAEGAAPPGPMSELEESQAERDINDQKTRDGAAMRDHQDQVREAVASRGGDALEQEVAAAEAGAAVGEELSNNIARMSTLLAQRQAADEEAAYADTQIEEDAARAQAQTEAAQRYEEGLKQVEQDTQAAVDKQAMVEDVESRGAKIKSAEVAETKRQTEAESETAAKTRASEKADEQINKLRKRRQELGLEPKKPLDKVSELPSAEEVEVFKGKKRSNIAMAEAFTSAANEAATSPTNDLPTPSKNQLEKGNYKKGHPRMHGLGITIESPAGSTRTAVDGSWSRDMQDDYGYIKGTESAEGKTEQLDVFVGKDHESDNVFVIDQVNKEGAFDEHKVMMGYPNEAAARKAYLRNYPKGFKLGPISTLKVDEFKQWLNSGDQTVPYSGKKLAGTPKATPATAEQVEEVIQNEPQKGGRRSRILFRKGEAAEEGIRKAAPRDILDDIQEVSEGFEDGENLKLAFEDVIDVAEDSGDRKHLTKLRKVGIEIGMFRVIEEKEISRIIVSGGKAWDFVLGGKKYVYDTDYQTEAQRLAAEGLAEEEQAATSKRKSRILFRKGEEGNSERLVSEIKQSGGFSVDNKTGQPVTEGYAVGQNLEEVIEGEATPEQLDAFREKHADSLSEPGNILGAWYNPEDGKTYLDVSKVFADRNEAMMAGMKNNELAIQDLSKDGEGTISLQAEEEVDAVAAPEAAQKASSRK